MKPRVGEMVLFERYGLDTGTVTRVGVSTATIKEDGDYGYTNSRVEFQHIYPLNADTAKILAHIKDIEREIENFTGPLNREKSQWHSQLRDLEVAERKAREWEIPQK